MTVPANAQEYTASIGQDADSDDALPAGENDVLAGLARFAEVSHDLMNLLTVVACHTELMRDRLSDPENAASLDIIMQAIDRATDLNHDLLISGQSVWSRLGSIPRVEPREHDVDSVPH